MRKPQAALIFTLKRPAYHLNSIYFQPISFPSVFFLYVACPEF